MCMGYSYLLTHCFISCKETGELSLPYYLKDLISKVFPDLSMKHVKKLIMKSNIVLAFICRNTIQRQLYKKEKQLMKRKWSL